MLRNLSKPVSMNSRHFETLTAITLLQSLFKKTGSRDVQEPQKITFISSPLHLSAKIQRLLEITSLKIKLNLKILWQLNDPRTDFFK